jgi:hypothetical protein
MKSQAFLTLTSLEAGEDTTQVWERRLMGGGGVRCRQGSGKEAEGMGEAGLTGCCICVAMIVCVSFVGKLGVLTSVSISKVH